MNELYIIKYEPDGDGAPYFFGLDWSPNLPTFHYPTENPEVSNLSSYYTAAADTPKLNADWLPDHFLASSNFLAVCDIFNCSYISRPVEIFIRGEGLKKDKYSFFLVAERIRAMDMTQSSFVIDSNAKPDIISSTTVSYERIDKLVVLEQVASDLFFFEEIKEVVCSARFLTECRNKNICGLTFEKIDDNYTYAPWDDF